MVIRAFVGDVPSVVEVLVHHAILGEERLQAGLGIKADMPISRSDIPPVATKGCNVGWLDLGGKQDAAPIGQQISPVIDENPWKRHVFNDLSAEDEVELAAGRQMVEIRVERGRSLRR